MLEIPVSPELKARLAGKVRGMPVGAGKLHRIGDGGNAGKSAPRHQPADQVGNQPMSMRQGRVIRERPSLIIMDGGKL